MRITLEKAQFFLATINTKKDSTHILITTKTTKMAAIKGPIIPASKEAYIIEPEVRMQNEQEKRYR